MRSRPDAPPVKLTEACDVGLIVAHMAASIGQQKALSVVTTVLADLKLPSQGKLEPAAADQVFERLQTETGLVGLAAKVSRQMVRLGVAPLKPAF